MIDLYIYYKVAVDQAPALWPRVQAMQAALSALTGVSGQLRRRPEADDGRQTWMEIYPAVTTEFDDALAGAVSDAGIGAWIDGPRHIEVFTDSRPCA